MFFWNYERFRENISKYKKNIITPATKYADVKVFCHFYDLKEIDNIRSQEKQKIINQNWHLFKAYKLISEEPNYILKIIL